MYALSFSCSNPRAEVVKCDGGAYDVDESSHRVGSGSDTGPLDFESPGLIQDP